MSISAVGFLFQNKGLRGNKFTCTIHKKAPNGTFSRNVICSPSIKKSQIDFIDANQAKQDFIDSVNAVSSKGRKDKFIGATIKDGVKETEIHSIISNKLFAVRTKDENGQNHFRVSGRNNTQKTLIKNLNLSV